MAKSIQHQIFYPNTAQEVWEYLTVAERKFKFTSLPMPDFNFDGIFYCKVLEIIPFKKLAYSWNFGSGNGMLNKSEVHWSLTEKNKGTELQLEHRGFEGVDILPIFGAMDKGWLQNIHKIQKLLNPKSIGTTQA